MRIAYTTTFDSRDVHNWSGTPYYMSKAFAQEGCEVQYIGSLQRKLPPLFRFKRLWNKYLSGQRESPRFNIFVAKHYSYQVAQQLEKLSVDVIISPLVNPIAYLECKQPIVLWTDALYAALIGFYSPFSVAHSVSSITQGNKVTAECLSRCQLAVFSSEWAASSAIQLYGINRDKVKVIPFGANIDTYPSFEEIKESIKKRSTKTIKLLFLAKTWERKGGDIVVAVAKALHAAGHSVELNLVGAYPPNLKSPPPYIRCLGFISKHTVEGQQKLHALLADSHFLFVPSRAEAYGIVFCEANAFGIPCLTTYVGGIGTIIKDNINGMSFALNSPVEIYCDYILNLMHDRARYEALALSAYHEFETRLNWKVATGEMKRLIEKI